LGAAFTVADIIGSSDAPSGLNWFVNVAAPLGRHQQDSALRLVEQPA